MTMVEGEVSNNFLVMRLVSETTTTVELLVIMMSLVVLMVRVRENVWNEETETNDD